LTRGGFLVRIVNMLELLAQLRSATGRQNKQIRKQGIIPAILYGHKVKNLLLSIKQKDFKKVYQKAGESALIKLDLERGESTAGKKERIVLIHSLDKDPVSDKIIHVDFYQVKMDEPITTEVPLVFNGKSLAVDREGGVLIKNFNSIEVKALPLDLPREIEVDISCLKTFDDNIYVKDLKIPARAEITAEDKEVVASVVPPRTKAELEELEEAPVEEIEQVEEEKREEARDEESPDLKSRPQPEGIGKEE
jgi:large subunit ribosomal protein L25